MDRQEAGRSISVFSGKQQVYRQHYSRPKILVQGRGTRAQDRSGTVVAWGGLGGLQEKVVFGPSTTDLEKSLSWKIILPVKGSGN